MRTRYRKIATAALSASVLLGWVTVVSASPSFAQSFVQSDEETDFVGPPFNPYPSYYELHRRENIGAGNNAGIAPPVNPYPHKQVDTNTQTRPEEPVNTPTKTKKKSPKKTISSRSSNNR